MSFHDYMSYRCYEALAGMGFCAVVLLVYTVRHWRQKGPRP